VVDEHVVGGGENGAERDGRPAVGGEQRDPEGDVDGACPAKQDVERNAQEFRADVVFEQSQVDDDCLRGERDHGAAAEQRDGGVERPRQERVSEGDEAHCRRRRRERPGTGKCHDRLSRPYRLKSRRRSEQQSWAKPS